MTLADITRPEPSGGLKQGFQTTDHAGWFLLDGRALAPFTQGQKAIAAAYGWTTNLPNFTNRELIDSTAAFGALGGANTSTLTQANLPAYTMTGTLDQQTNNHNHSLNNAGAAIRHPSGAGYKSAGNGNNRGARTITVNQGGAHNHSFPIPLGSGTAINTENRYLSTNAFVYLGAT